MGQQGKESADSVKWKEKSGRRTGRRHKGCQYNGVNMLVIS